MHAYSAPLTTTLLLLRCCLRRSGEGPLLVAATPCCVGSSVGIRCTNNYHLYPSPSCFHSQPLRSSVPLLHEEPPCHRSRPTRKENFCFAVCRQNQGVGGPDAVKPCPMEIPTATVEEVARVSPESSCPCARRSRPLSKRCCCGAGRGDSRKSCPCHEVLEFPHPCHHAAVGMKTCLGRALPRRGYVKSYSNRRCHGEASPSC